MTGPTGSRNDIAAVLAEGEAVVKTATWTDRELTLQSENAENNHPQRVFGPDDDVRVLGKAVGALREL